MSQSAKIRGTIASTQKTRKVTSALELVAASKLNKTQEVMSASRPYAEKMLQVIGHIANCTSEYKHPFLQKRAVKRVGYIVVSSDRGLCGALNLALFKETLQHMQNWQAKKVGVDTCLFGNKAIGFFNRHGFDVLAHASNIGDKPSVESIIGVVQTLLEAYYSGNIDRVYLASNTHVNTMVQKPKILQLMPLLPSKLEKTSEYWDYLYEPDAKEVMDTLLNRYIECEVYQGIIENIACEQAARMLAMKNATDNAGEIIDGLKLAYKVWTTPIILSTLGLSPILLACANTSKPCRLKKPIALLPNKQVSTPTFLACQFCICCKVSLNKAKFKAPHKPRSLETTIYPTRFTALFCKNGCLYSLVQLAI